MHRRFFVLAGLAALTASPALAEAPRPTRKRGFNFNLGLPARTRYRGRKVVEYASSEKPGTIVVDTRKRTLFYVLPERRAIAYGVGVGREGFTWSGVARVGRKAEWPRWIPPPEMVARDPLAAQFAEGMPGGRNNPLGARALYLFQGNADTLFRIHGTREPWTIGYAVSSGCIRMLNREVIDLYQRVEVGTKVIVL
ncbi:MAG: L,D-transpeptidase [Pseudomonadota bacterium]|nr:L,D-transpeptidase [Pseudomonadota bacterium]